MSPTALDQLLEAGAIEYRNVGSNRRIMSESLDAFLQADSLARRGAADELDQLGQGLGLG